MYRISYHHMFFMVLLLSLSVPCDQFESFQNSYNLLTTIAGKGSQGDDQNEWNTSFEGKSATEAMLSGPHFAMADSVGNVFIADKDAHTIRKVDKQGIISTVAGINSPGDGSDGTATEKALKSPNGLWVKSSGEFYILDLGNSKIKKVNTTGNMTTIFKDDEGISLGRGLWVSKAEDTIWYCSGTAVKMWTEAQGIITYASGFTGLGNIVQDNDGYVIATDRVANLVYRIDKNREKIVVAGNGLSSGGGNGNPALETAFYGVRGVWFFKDNSFLLATHEGSQIWYIDSQSTAHLFLNGKEGDEYHSGDGEIYNTPGYKISEVRSVTVDYQDNIIITENDRGFIRKISKSNVSVLGRKIQKGSKSITLMVNPINGLSYLSFTGNCINNYDISMFDSQGRSVPVKFIRKLNKDIHDICWDSKFLTSGSYFVRIQSDSFRFTNSFHIAR